MEAEVAATASFATPPASNLFAVNKKPSICMIVKCLLSYIQFID